VGARVAAETTDTALKPLTVILRSEATKDLVSLVRSWPLTRDTRSFASLRMT